MQFQRAVNQFWRNNIINGLTTIYGEWIPVEFDTFDITLNDGLNSRWEGYGYNEHEVKTAYFKGITANVKKKKNN